MEGEEPLELLRQGADIWNIWREENPSIIIDLGGIDLTGASLNQVDFSELDLRTTCFYATLLDDANFSGATLFETIFNGSTLRGADFYGAVIGNTIFGDVDLSETVGLENVIHRMPSTVGMNTIQQSKGKIPSEFLRGCGFSDLEIETAKLYSPNLTNHEIDDILYKIHDLRARQAVQVSPLFISYSHTDAAFVNQLEVKLNEKGIRFWRDIHDAKAGRLEKQIEHAIRHNPTVLVVLSKNSIKSDWVEHEVRKARRLEKELGRDVLCPVALDDSWKSSPWPERVMEQVMEYNILDFSRWQDEKVFGQIFVKLLDGLQLFYKG